MIASSFAVVLKLTTTGGTISDNAVCASLVGVDSVFDRRSSTILFLTIVIRSSNQNEAFGKNPEKRLAIEEIIAIPIVKW